MNESKKAFEEEDRETKPFQEYGGASQEPPDAGRSMETTVRVLVSARDNVRGVSPQRTKKVFKLNFVFFGLLLLLFI